MYFLISSLLVSMTHHTVDPDFTNLQGKRKLVSKKRRVREIGGKMTGETTFGSSYREVRKTEGSRNRDFTAILIIKNSIQSLNPESL